MITTNNSSFKIVLIMKKVKDQLVGQMDYAMETDCMYVLPRLEENEQIYSVRFWYLS